MRSWLQAQGPCGLQSPSRVTGLMGCFLPPTLVWEADLPLSQMGRQGAGRVCQVGPVPMPWCLCWSSAQLGLNYFLSGPSLRRGLEPLPYPRPPAQLQLGKPRPRGLTPLAEHPRAGQWWSWGGGGQALAPTTGGLLLSKGGLPAVTPLPLSLPRPVRGAAKQQGVRLRLRCLPRAPLLVPGSSP